MNVASWTTPVLTVRLGLRFPFDLRAARSAPSRDRLRRPRFRLKPVQPRQAPMVALSSGWLSSLQSEALAAIPRQRDSKGVWVLGRRPEWGLVVSYLPAARAARILTISRGRRMRPMLCVRCPLHALPPRSPCSTRTTTVGLPRRSSNREYPQGGLLPKSCRLPFAALLMPPLTAECV